MNDLELPAEWWSLDANTVDPADAHTVWCFTSVNTCGGFPEATALTVARDESLAYAMRQQDAFLRREARQSRLVDHTHPDFPRAMEWLIPYMREHYPHVLQCVVDDAPVDGVIRSHGFPMAVACAMFVEAKVKA